MWKVAIKYAVVNGAFLILLFWLSFRLGSNPLIDFRHFFIDVIIFGLFIFFSCREFKIYHNQGVFHFWQGMTLGFMTYVPASIIFALGLTLFFLFDPNLMDRYIVQAETFLIENQAKFSENISKDMLQKQIEDLKDVTAKDLVISSVLKKLMVGFFISPVISIILRKKPN
jgi:hypothetical protein